MGGGQVLATQMNELQTKSLSFPRISRIDRFKISTGLELTQSVINFPIFSLHSGNFDSNFFYIKKWDVSWKSKKFEIGWCGCIP